MIAKIIRARAQRILFKLAGASAASWLVSEVFAHMSFLIPIERLRETSSLIAFNHPSPSYPFHVLLIPKRTYRSMLDVLPDDQIFFHDLFTEVQSLVRQFGLDANGYRLITNGGKYQDIPMLHFHLISDIAAHENTL